MYTEGAAGLVPAQPQMLRSQMSFRIFLILGMNFGINLSFEKNLPLFFLILSKKSVELYVNKSINNVNTKANLNVFLKIRIKMIKATTAKIKRVKDFIPITSGKSEKK